MSTPHQSTGYASLKEAQANLELLADSLNEIYYRVEAAEMPVLLEHVTMALQMTRDASQRLRDGIGQVVVEGFKQAEQNTANLFGAVLAGIQLKSRDIVAQDAKKDPDDATPTQPQ